MPKEPSQHLRDGMITYEKSGHSLTFVNGYYVCSKYQKGECINKEEKRIESLNFEKKLARSLESLKIREEDFIKCKYEFERWEIDLREKNEYEILLKQQSMDAILDNCKQKGEISQRDEKDLKDLYVKILEFAFPAFSIGMARPVMESLVLIEQSKRMATVLAFAIFKKIYITNDGEIKSIDLEGYGEYIFKYLSKKIPFWNNELKIKINYKLDLPNTVNYIDTIEYFKKDNFKFFLSYSIFSSKYSIKKSLDKFITWERIQNIEDRLIFWRNVKERLWQDPLMFLSPTVIIKK
ncbi:hypothetical protein M0Q50_00110 [bacterium]|jgi:hypothetical protein|nr:hypothetical protein [bacterium]